MVGGRGRLEGRTIALLSFLALLIVPVARAEAAMSPVTASGPDAWNLASTPAAPVPGGSLESVSCTSATYCEAVGFYLDAASQYVPMAESWDGTSWTVQPMPNVSDGRTAVVDNPVSGELTGVSCASPVFCEAVGYFHPWDSPILMRWNGFSWAQQTPPPNSTLPLYGISCPTSSFCEAVGNGVALMWNGASWVSQQLPGPAPLDGVPQLGFQSVSCPSSSFCEAIGWSTAETVGLPGPVAATWNGASWVIGAAPVGGVTVSAVFCTGRSFCEAVGDQSSQTPTVFYTTLAERFDGSGWTIQSTPSPPNTREAYLVGVSCPTAADCSAVGWDVGLTSSAISTVAMSWDGSEWTAATVSSAASPGGLLGVSCPDGRSCQAVGPAGSCHCSAAGTGDPVTIDGWNGSDWSPEAATDPDVRSNASYSSISCAGAGGCEAVGRFATDSGVELARAAGTTGTGWQDQVVADTGLAATTTGHLASVSCVATSWCESVGGDFENVQSQIDVPLAEHWNGSQWSVQPVPIGDGDLRGVSCTTTLSCEAVGSTTAGTSLTAAAWNGLSWSSQSVPAPAGADETSLRAVSCTTAIYCVAVGYYFDNSTNHPLAAVYTGAVWSVQAVTAPPGSTGSTLNAIACLSAGCQAVGTFTDANGLQHPFAEGFSPTSGWILETLPDPSSAQQASLSGVSCALTSDCVAVGYSANSSGMMSPLVETWDGASWTPSSVTVAAGSGHTGQADLTAVSCPLPGSCTAAGDYTDSQGNEDPMVEALTGAIWTEEDTAPPEQGVWSALDAVTCPADTSCTAGGDYTDRPGVIARLLEPKQNLVISASVPTLGVGTLTGISCTADNMCVQVGESSMDTGAPVLFLAQQGTQYPTDTEVSSNGLGWTGEGLYGVSCPSDARCEAVGYADDSTGAQIAMAVTWTGGQFWTFDAPVVPPASVSSKFTSISCPTVDYCKAVGWYVDAAGETTPLEETLSGSTWTIDAQPVPAPPGSSLTSVSCTSTITCEAVGATATPAGASLALAEDWDGASWTAQVVPQTTSSVSLASVSCPTTLSCWAVGSQQGGGPSTPIAERWDGASWQETALPQVPDSLAASLSAVSCPTSDSCEAVGSETRQSGITTALTLLYRPSPAPIVISVTPSAGPVAGGNEVTITGFGFSPDAAVDFGSQPATVQSCSATTCSVAAPAAAPGTVDVTVTTPSGTSPTSMADEYTYYPEPSVRAVLPNVGPTTGGTPTTINGTGFTATATVMFGDVPANVTCPTASACVAVAPPHPVGTVDVTVTTPGGTSPTGDADRYSYVGPPGPPIGVTAVAGINQARVSWVPPVSSGGMPILRYTATSLPGKQSCIVSDGTQCTIVGLPHNYRYTFTVTAATAAGTGPPSTPTAPIAVDCPAARGAQLAGAVGVSSVEIEGCPGYLVANSSGRIAAFGSARSYGDLNKTKLSARIIAITVTRDGGGYWLIGSDGGVFTFGDARFYGSTGAIHLKRPVVGLAPTDDDRGYWIVAQDGGVFCFGDARFYGSTGNIELAQPIDGIAVAPHGHGYWLVASDGGVFTFTNDGFYGSLGGVHLQKPIIGMAGTKDGAGYTLVAADGGVFSFGDAPFYGSLAGKATEPVVAFSSTPLNNGYYLLDSSGKTFAFGPGAASFYSP